MEAYTWFYIAMAVAGALLAGRLIAAILSIEENISAMRKELRDRKEPK